MVCGQWRNAQVVQYSPVIDYQLTIWRKVTNFTPFIKINFNRTKCLKVENENR